MILKKISIDRFLGWEHLVVDLSAFSGVTSVMAEIGGEKSRSNGAGKSSFVHAIIFALYGEVRGDSLDDLIKDRCAEGFKVVLELEQDGVLYAITRSKTLATSQKCVVHRLGGKKKEIVSDNPISFFKLPDYDIFSSSVYSPQNEISGFSDGKPAYQKEILQKLFSLEKYQKYERQARDLSLTVDSELKQSTATLEHLSGDIDRRKAEYEQILNAGFPDKIKKYTDAIASLTAEEDNLRSVLAAKDSKGTVRKDLVKKSEELAGEISSLERKATLLIESIESADQKVARSKKEIETYQARLSTAKIDKERHIAILSELDKAGDGSKELVGIENSISITRKALQTSLSAIEVAKAGAVSETARRDNLNRVGGVCPVCSSVVDDKHKSKVLSEVSKKLSEYREETEKHLALSAQLSDTVANLESELKLIQSREQRILKVKAEVAYYDSAINSALVSINSLTDYIKNTENTVSSGTAEASSITKKIEELEKEKSAVDAKISLIAKDDTDELIAKLAHIRSNLDLAHKNINTCNANIAVGDKLKEQIAEMSKSVELMCEARKDMFERQRVYKELSVAFGSSGIPVLILENEMQVLQQYISEYLSRLSGERLTLQIATTKKAATGKTSETLQLVCSTGNSNRKLSTFSGGERVRVYLAVRLAIAKYLKDIGVDFGFIIIDEVSDLDEDGLTSFVEALKELSSEFRNILVVSHLDRVNESFDSCLLFNKGNSAEY